MTTRASMWTVGFGVLLLGTIYATAQDNVLPQLPAKIELGGKDRYATYVSTDKQVYRAGEKVYVRAAVLRADNRKPLTDQQPQQVMVEVKGPKGDVVASGYASLADAVAGFAWEVPAGTAGGEYKVRVTHPWTGYVPGERKFDIRAYRAPRLKSQIVFLRDGYGAGDSAGATLHVDRAEGGAAAGAKVTAVARVDGIEVHRSETKVDEKGNAQVSFKLPAAIARGEGTLAWIIEDGGIVETATKTIPILLQTVDLAMYPEGGDLIAGLPNRVYLEAFTPAKKPADISGVIVDSKGNDVSAFRTEHEGRARFDLRPVKGEKYTLKINQPSGIKTTYALPEVKEDGVVLRAAAAVYEPGKPVKLEVTAPSPRKVRVTLSKREVEIASIEKELAIADGAAVLNPVELTPPADSDGVLIATVWDGARPVAERLIFRKPQGAIHVVIEADKKEYVPGDAVTLKIKTTDEAGKAISSLVGITVSDDSVREMIEKREQSPALPVMVLLEGDVKELADAEVYLNASDDRAPMAVDLLLGTQGWRRFAFIDAAKFIENHGDDARRVLALKVITAEQRDRFAMRFWADGAARPEALAAQPRRLGEAERFGVQNGQRGAEIEGVALLRADPGKDGNVQAAELQQAAKFAREPELAERNKVLAGDELKQALDKKNEALAEQDAFGGRRLRQMGQGRMKQDMVLVREYAHNVRSNRKATDRVDFTETLYWNAVVKTSEKGEASVSFSLSDAVTSFRAAADAFDGRGALGAGVTKIESVQPFYAEPKLPLQVTSGDVIRLPVTLINGTSGNLASARIAALTANGITVGQVLPFDLTGKARVRRIVDVKVGDYVGNTEFIIEARAQDYVDKVMRRLDVRPIGFPVEQGSGGLVGPAGSATYIIEIPADVVAGSVGTEISVFPTPLANMMQALEALIRQPYGCFEQTSSTSYPLVMAQQYFMSHTGVDPKLIEKSKTFLDQSYQRLIGFECKTSKGFEWFGADPGHEALSAYGLMQFTDMAQVREVDGRMLKDTRAFILKTRDGKGGFKRERNTLHTWVADPDCSNGYILWSLLESGEKPDELAKEIAAYKELIAKSSNSYAIALGANIFALAGDKATSKALMDKLSAKQHKDGFVDGATQSIVGSNGDALNIETTALACLAWMREPMFAANVEKAMKYLAESCKGGRFGSTQSTVLALKAIVKYDKNRSRPKNSGVLRVLVDGKEAGEPVAFGPETQGTISLQNVAYLLTPGRHTIEVKMSDGSQMPYAVLVKFNRMQPDSSEKCKVGIEVGLADQEIAEGNVTEATVTVSNRTKEVVPTPIAIVGIPGGLEVRHDQLKELVKSGKIAAYEVTGREVVLYWRELKADEKVSLPISLIAAIPGEYTGPASRAYLYYTDEDKQWAKGVAVKINAKE